RAGVGEHSPHPMPACRVLPAPPSRVEGGGRPQLTPPTKIAPPLPSVAVVCSCRSKTLLWFGGLRRSAGAAPDCVDNLETDRALDLGRVQRGERFPKLLHDLIVDPRSRRQFVFRLAARLDVALHIQLLSRLARPSFEHLF